MLYFCYIFVIFFKLKIEFLKNLKTINFSDLKPTNINGINNFKYVLPNEMEESDSNKVEILKTYHENGAVKEEIEAVTNALHASKLFQDELNRPGATVQSVVQKLGVKHMSAAEFERGLGVPWPL